MSGWGVPNLESTFSQLSRAAKDIGSHLGSSLNSVAENLEGAFIHIGEGVVDRAGCVTRASSSSDSEVETFVFGPELSQSEGSERERVYLSQQTTSGSMGCGSSYTASISDPYSSNQENMMCDLCQIRLNFINRKKACAECGNWFCGSCLPREAGNTRTCSRCKVLVRKPGERTELMKLRVKDLQNYLCRKKINIKSCVEKKDLVELVLQTNGDYSEVRGSSRIPASRSWEDSTIRVSDQVPLERSTNFPSSYVDSSHRREWFEKFGGNSGSSNPDIPTEPSNQYPDLESMESTSLEEIQPLGLDSRSPAHTCTPVELFNAGEGAETQVQGVNSGGEEEAEVHTVEADEEEFIEVTEESSDSESYSRISIDPPSNSEGAVGGNIPGSEVMEDVQEVIVDELNIGDKVDPPQVTREIGEERVAGPTRLQPDLLSDQRSKSVPSSPRRFANQGVVYLSEIQSAQDLRELSAKQIKEILAMNRVNFKGCVEKEELLKIVERLWTQEQRNKEALDTMEDDSLCKICMDAPIDCVMLECGHMCTCTNCGKQMAECPICRQYVIRVVRTFKS